MTAPAARIDRGIVCRQSSISSPIVDALSTPPNANAIVDQKMTSFSPVLGTSACASSGVADPNRLHEMAPSAISAAAGTQLASAPTLLSHLPTFSPTTFSVTVRARPAIDTTMKYMLLDDHACHGGPPMKRAFAAAKYSSPGRYGRFDPQYVQPVMNAANGPNARLLQT